MKLLLWVACGLGLGVLAVCKFALSMGQQAFLARSGKSRVPSGERLDGDWMGPPTLWHLCELEQDPLSPVLDGRPVEISRGF